MQIKSYFKNIAKAVFKGAPNYGVGWQMMTQGLFSWGLNGSQAYMNKIFYSATNIMVLKLTETPMVFSIKKTKSNTDKFYSKTLTNEARKAYKALNLQEVEEHPLNLLFDNPNKYQSGIELLEDFWHNYTFGDGYLFFEGLGELSRNTKPVAVHSLARSRVMAVQSTDNFNAISHYTYTTWNGNQIRIEKENILHLKHWNPNIGDLKGLGVDVIAGMDISLNNANNEMQGASFKNGGRGTLMSSDSSISADGEKINKMSKEQTQDLKDTVERDMQGIKNYKRIHFTNGYVNVQQFGDTLVENDALNAEDKQWRNIYTIVGVPFVLSPAASNVSENSIIAGYKAFVTNLIISELRKFDQKLTAKIQQWYPYIIATHDLTEFTELAPDLKLMKEVYGSPLLYEDERRSIFGYDDLPNNQGKIILVPSGLITLDDLIDSSVQDDSNADAL